MKRGKKLLAVILVLTLIFANAVPTTLAEEAIAHVHDENCGYSEGTCSHDHEADTGEAAEAAGGTQSGEAASGSGTGEAVAAAENSLGNSAEGEAGEDSGETPAAGAAEGEGGEASGNTGEASAVSTGGDGGLLRTLLRSHREKTERRATLRTPVRKTGRPEAAEPPMMEAEKRKAGKVPPKKRKKFYWDPC